jgi:hypothetical protein
MTVKKQPKTRPKMDQLFFLTLVFLVSFSISKLPDVSQAFQRAEFLIIKIFFPPRPRSEKRYIFGTR